MRYFIGLDNGGTVIKACLYDETGRQICVERAKVDLVIPKEGYTERVLSDVLNANLAVLKGVVEKSGVCKENIKSIGISGHGKGLYLLDKQGNDLYNGIVSTDTRAVNIRKTFDKGGISQKIYEQNYQKVLESQPVCLLRWFKDNNREVYDKIGFVLSVKDYIRYKLTGNIAFERTDISGSNLINLSTGKKDIEQLKLFGIEEMYDCIPNIVNACDNCGCITGDIARKTGLSEQTVVSGGMFDINACALSTGVITPEDICVIAGTWSINEYISVVPVTAAKSMNSYYCLPGYYLVEECSPTSAGNLEWYLQNVCVGKSYNEINEMVASIKPEDCNVVFLPFLFASNEENLDMKTTFVGLSAMTTQAEMLRSVYEGIVFAHKSHIDKLLSAREKPRAIRLTGGAANSDVWSQMFADAIGIKVEVIADREHGCFGAGISGAVACGIYPDVTVALKETVKADKVFYPNLDEGKIYNDKYKKYRRLVTALDSYYIEK